MMPQERFDVSVVGAGAAGIAAALTLAREGFRTCLVGEPEAPQDGRTVALLDGSVRFLRFLGVWPALEQAAAPLARLQIVDDSGSLFRPPPVAFAAAEIGLDAFGWNVENKALVGRLWEAARTAANLTCRAGRSRALRIAEGGAVLVLEDGATVEADLVVAADGSRSALREAARIGTRRWTYAQSALTAILGHERDHRDVSTEFHTREGPFTLVPLPGQRSSLVWVARPDRAARLAGLDEEALALAIEAQAHSLLGKMRLEGRRGLVPLTGLSVERYVAPRLALVGEAAHIFPPIGAQGLNLGLRDAAGLRDALVDARERGSTPGSPFALDRYQRGRDLDVRLRRAAVDGLNRSLLADLVPVDFLRGAGLLLVGGIGPLRRAVMREGVLPRLGAPRLMRADGPSR